MIYLSGAISAKTNIGLQKNKYKMARKAAELRALGLEVYDPQEYEPQGMSWSWYLAYDLKWIFENKPDGMYMMKGWKKSAGAKLEHETALQLGINIIYEEF